MTRLERLKAAVAAWDRASETYAEYGAADTEPETVFQYLLARAYKGNDAVAPLDGDGWQLFTDSMNCTYAANALSDAAEAALLIVRTCPVNELKTIRPFLADYCWRIGL